MRREALSHVASHLSPNVRKRPLEHMRQRRLKSACASAQSDYSFRCPYVETLHAWLPEMRANALADLNLPCVQMLMVCFLTLWHVCFPSSITFFHHCVSKQWSWLARLDSHDAAIMTTIQKHLSGSLIRVFTEPFLIAKAAKFLHVAYEDSVQT